MISKETIARINELSHKQQAGGLTEDEKQEQAALRRLYIDHIKNQVRAQLDGAVPAKQPHDCGCGCHHHNH